MQKELNGSLFAEKLWNLFHVPHQDVKAYLQTASIQEDLTDNKLILTNQEFKDRNDLNQGLNQFFTSRLFQFLDLSLPFEAKDPYESLIGSPICRKGYFVSFCGRFYFTLGSVS